MLLCSLAETAALHEFNHNDDCMSPDDKAVSHNSLSEQSMWVVTGAKGFIGSNMIHALKGFGGGGIVAVDVAPDPEIETARSGLNVHDHVSDYMDKDALLTRLDSDKGFAEKITGIFHEGACSATIEKDEQLVMGHNYEYSKLLFKQCRRRGIALQYASTAGVYGRNRDSTEDPRNETALTLYACSKLKFDRHVRRLMHQMPSDDAVPVVGLRYFNVYGPGESHKGYMRSTPLVFHEQLKQSGKIGVFAAGEGCAAGEHRRDFIHIDDVVAMKLWFFEHCGRSGIYNAGTGVSRKFREVAESVIAYHGFGEIEYVEFPERLKGSYQSYTQANLKAVREAGYRNTFMPIEAGIKRYLDDLTGKTCRSTLPYRR